MISIKIAIAFSISISVVYGWLKPSAEYLNDFAEGHGKPTIVIYLPEFIPSQWIKWHKKYDSTYIAYCIKIFFSKYLYIFSFIGFKCCN